MRPAESGDTKKSLSDCVLNTWKDLRPVLEVGAAESVYITAIELVSKEPIKVNLTLTNPRALEEEPLTNDNIKKLMNYELSDLSRERSLAVQRAARRAAAAPNAGVVEDGLEESEASASSHDNDTIEIENVADEVEDEPDVVDDDEDDDDVLANNDVYESSKALVINKRSEEVNIQPGQQSLFRKTERSASDIRELETSAHQQSGSDSKFSQEIKGAQ